MQILDRDTFIKNIHDLIDDNLGVIECAKNPVRYEVSVREQVLSMNYIANY